MANLHDLITWLQIHYNSADSNLLHCALYLIAGIIAGMLLRSCGRFLFLLVCALGVSLFLLHSTHMVTFNSSLLNYYSDLQQTFTFEESAPLVIAWLKAHLALASAASIGFLVGWKIG